MTNACGCVVRSLLLSETVTMVSKNSRDQGHLAGGPHSDCSQQYSLLWYLGPARRHALFNCRLHSYQSIVPRGAAGTRGSGEIAS
jgi:hypothetical protein